MHIKEKSGKETTATTLNGRTSPIANAKRTLLGISHKIKGKYLQSYLDEFCYKLNRRYFDDDVVFGIAVDNTIHFLGKYKLGIN